HTTRIGNSIAGYYDSTSQYPRVVADKSNEREMFVINLDTMASSIGTARYEAVLAHELQHMVHWAVDLNEDTWLNEGLSELARMVTGYGVSPFSSPFLSAPQMQLNHWPEASDERGRHYGGAFMFVAYFYDRYGEAATTTLVGDVANGMESVENTLLAINARDPLTDEPVSAEALFADWLVANLLMDSSVGDGRYAYQHPDTAALSPATVAQTLTAGQSRAVEGVQWGATYMLIPGGSEPQQLTLSFDGAQTVRIVPSDAYSGSAMWWSNRTDESDTRLTRAFDLSGVDSATLNFQLWYHIENLWDYGYVMVSTDDGTTWIPLESARTTTENPHGNAFGAGYTGSSAGWVPETIDLTPYAGQQIMLRFEYITDAAVTQPGMLVDDISIPEIGYFSDVESGDDGWLSEGWLRTDNVLPQYFSVQIVQPDNPDSPVTHLLAGGDQPRGEWPIMVGGAYGDALVVVSGLAPVTSEPAVFTLGLAQ
ncbi:MAG: immune inhibitor A, partial [Anaerolineae bacterium]|nr:immune inhibitor A [Anaerolineae bacterium]